MKKSNNPYGSEPGVNMKDTNSTLGKLLRKWRLNTPGKIPISQQRVGDVLGVVQTMISKVELGLTTLSKKHVPKLIKLYKLNPAQIKLLRMLMAKHHRSQPVVMPYTEKATRKEMARTIKHIMDRATVKQAKAITAFARETCKEKSSLLNKGKRKYGSRTKSK